MAVTARELNRATLARQSLLARTDASVGDLVRQILALQAQEPASPYLALWARTVDLDPAAVDAAFADGTLVKATLARITLHAVHADDHRLFHHAMQPTLRAANLNDRRFTSTGLTAADADGCLDELLPWLSTPRSNAEVEAWFADRGVVEARALWSSVRRYAPVRHAPGEAPWSFGASPAHVAAAFPPPAPDDRAGADAALAELVVRYLTAFGPASIADMAQFLLVQRGRLKPIVAGLGGRLVEVVQHHGPQLFDVPGGARPPADAPAPPRLLPMWDSILFAFHDRTRVIDDDVRAHVIRRNGDTLPSLLVDGRVVGVWRHVDGRIEGHALAPVAEEDWAGLADEAAGLLPLLEAREPEVYGRYRRWWDRLPAGDTRVLAVV